MSPYPRSISEGVVFTQPVGKRQRNCESSARQSASSTWLMSMSQVDWRLCSGAGNPRSVGNPASIQSDFPSVVLHVRVAHKELLLVGCPARQGSRSRRTRVTFAVPESTSVPASSTAPPHTTHFPRDKLFRESIQIPSAAFRIRQACPALFRLSSACKFARDTHQNCRAPDAARA